MEIRRKHVIEILSTFCLLTTLMQCYEVASLTVEEGRAAFLPCPGFKPNASADNKTVFNWYKTTSYENATSVNRVAFYSKEDDIMNSEGDLEGRATIDSTTGALKITQTTVSDDHIYKCLFYFTSSGTVKNETQLNITVTPTASDLKVTAYPPGSVQPGESITFNCSVSRVRPPDGLMLWKFSDGKSRYGQYIKEINSDNLTYTVSVSYTLENADNFTGKTFACQYLTGTGKTLISDAFTIAVVTTELTSQVHGELTGRPCIFSNLESVKFNSNITLTCDTTQIVERSIQWYAFQHEDGTLLQNSSQPTLIYNVRVNEQTSLGFICIAGNSIKQTEVSRAVIVFVNSGGGKNRNLIPVYIFIALGNAIALVLIANMVVLCKRWNKVTKPRLDPEVEIPVNFSRGPTSDERELYANANLGEDKTMSEDGVIYTQPEFVAVPNNVSAPTEITKRRNHQDHIPTDYSEVDFKKTAEMKQT